MPETAPTALVTGGRRGIGRGCAYALAEAGFHVVVNDLVDDDATTETLAGIEARGRRGAFVGADISDLDAHERLVEEAVRAFGAIHCLVNNAGVSVLSRGDLLDVSPESYDRCLDINLRGPFFLTQRVARHMLESEPATTEIPRSIVVISSVNAEALAVTRGEYCVSKAGLAMMSKLFAVRLAEAGIGVYEIRPGIIRTDMTAVASERYDREIAGGLTPIRRWGEPEDVGRAAATAATGGLPFSVGQAIYVDGGLTLRTF